jgi:hypothetical protein
MPSPTSTRAFSLRQPSFLERLLTWLLSLLVGRNERVSADPVDFVSDREVRKRLLAAVVDNRELKAHLARVDELETERDALWVRLTGSPPTIPTAVPFRSIATMPSTDQEQIAEDEPVGV